MINSSGATFVYAPGVKVFIELYDGNGKKTRIIDVSDDLVQGTMIRRSDGVSTFNFSLMNNQRKYDYKFTPNDRIIVLMKRVTWLRVFTGYLNSVPLLNAWPKDVQLTASCSLKKLQYWYWDPYAQYTQNMIRNAFAAGTQGGDGGVTNVILSILSKVVGWPEKKVHISAIPPAWSTWALKIAKEVSAGTNSDPAIDGIDTSIGDGSGTSNNDGLNNVKAGWFGIGARSGATGGNLLKFNQKQVDAAAAIYRHMARTKEIVVGKKRGYAGKKVKVSYTADDIAFVIFCALCETSLNPKYSTASGPGKGFGIFSQITNTPSFQTALLNIDVAIDEFLDRYYTRAKGGTPAGRTLKWATPAMSGRAHQVQRFGKAGLYGKASVLQAVTTVGTANYREEGLFDRLNRAHIAWAVQQGGQSGEGQGTNTSSKPTNLALAQKVNTLWSDSEQAPTPIKYVQVTGSARSKQINSTSPTKMDCSMLVCWAYVQTTGKPASDVGFNTREQWGKFGSKDFIVNGSLKSNWTRAQKLKWAKETQGALLYIRYSNGTPHHVGISTGKGDGSVWAMSYSHSDVGKDFRGPSDGAERDWTDGAQMPGINYAVSGEYNSSQSAPSAAAANTDTSAAGQGGMSFTIPDSEFTKLFGNTWQPNPTINNTAIAESAALTGIRYLLNDSQLLTYLRDLTSSGMRSLCSAPNGDFIAWFPDYYGLWGTASKITIEPIELIDLQVAWSDDYFVTHQYTSGGFINYYDPGTGLGETFTAVTGGADIRVSTAGIATIEIPEIMSSLFGVDVKNFDAQKILTRFGARPDYKNAPGPFIGKLAEFFSALYLFQQQWVFQFTADVQMTFMPELWPGMIIQIPEFDFQAYVVTVTHSFQFGAGGRFQTTVNISAPGRMPNSKNPADARFAFVGMPNYGGLQTTDSSPYVSDIDDTPYAVPGGSVQDYTYYDNPPGDVSRGVWGDIAYDGY